jgi:predicted acyltransferase
MNHVKWEGFHFFDLIFPLFMFISGVAIPYAITAKLEKGMNKSPLQLKIIRRGLILVLFGILYNGALQKGFADLRYASVLGQIGLAYLFAATIVLHTKTLKIQMLWLILILAAIAVLQLAVPIAGQGAGTFHRANGINAWLDQLLLPGKLYNKTFDPEGILCIVSATTVTLMGAIAGSLLRSDNFSQDRKALILTIAGAVLVIIAVSLSPVYPIIKKLWTVPFNLLTAGISLLLLSLFYFLADIKKWGGKPGSKIAFFFKVIGLNSITIYMGARIIPFRDISAFFTGWLVAPVGEWILIIGAIIIEWLFLYYLYRQKIFLRV